MAEAVLPLENTGRRSRIDYSRLSLISAAHLMNDLYGNLLTSLMPYLVLQGRITTTLAGFILLVYLLGSSVLQPLFGLFADQSGRRVFAVLGPIGVGIGACAVGWAPNAAVLFALAALAGVGTSAFHPQAASMVDRVGSHSKGWSMSLFSMGGNLGFAFGPILAAGIAVVGLHWSPLAIFPGIALTVLLARSMPSVDRAATRRRARDLLTAARGHWSQLNLIVSVIATRSAAQYALIIFLPLYYHERGLSAELGSLSAFVLSFAGAIGGIIGGAASDRYGRKLVVVASLIASAPLLLASLLIEGPFVWPLLALSGITLLASNSVTVVQGQELLPENTGIASGLTLGLGFGLSGVIASALTTLSDHIGVGTTIFLVPGLPLVAATLGALISSRRPLVAA